MKLQDTFRKKVMAFTLVGAAAAIMAAAPYTMVSAAEPGPGPRPPQAMDGRFGGPEFMPVNHKMAFSHRIQQMVKDGKITADQALKLNKEIQRFQKKQQKEHRHFVASLPDKTGISSDTLKEIFTPPKGHPMPPRDR